MSKKFSETLPKYFLIDFDIFVKLYQDGDEVVGINAMGNPYPPRKALAVGMEISKEEFDNQDSSRFDYKS